MKIIQYLGSLGACGAESVIRDYALALSKRGHEVIVPIYYDASESPNQRILEDNSVRIDILRGKYSSNILCRIYNKVLTLLGYNRRYVKKILKTEYPDVIHLHGYVLEDFRNLDEELDGIKLFYTCHNPPQEFFGGRFKRQYDIAKKLIDDHGMKLIALTSEMAKELNHLFGISDTIVLNNPIDVRKFKYPTKNRNIVRKEIGIPADAFVVGHVGRFHYQKNHIFLIDVFNKVLSYTNNPFLLLIASSEKGTQQEVFERIHKYGLEDKVKILYDRSDVENLYAAMDVFVFPSHFEGLGLAFLEAQISGLKCVISDQITKDSIVSPKVIQLSLDENLNEWANAIVGQIPSYKNCKNVEDFNLNNVIDKLELLYACDK